MIGSFKGLVDSGLTDCFIDLHFVVVHNLSLCKIDPLLLTLITCGYSFAYKFYITKLKDLYSIILGHDWLSQYNPLIDWVKGILKPYTAKIDLVSDPKKVIITSHYNKTKTRNPNNCQPPSSMLSSTSGSTKHLEPYPSSLSPMSLEPKNKQHT